jgi:2,5-diketo-D-gluconate reductase A
MAGVPILTLNDGNTIPQLGLGVWQVEPAITARVVRDGIAAGYRLIDTAEGYDNEQGVGEAIRTADVAREQLFITSKLRNGGHARDLALGSFEETMLKLGLERLDMFLIHWPVPGQDKYVEAWKTLVELQQQGRIASIGVSNFNRDHIERIIGETGVTPAVNQIELHRWHVQQGNIVIPKSTHAKRQRENIDVFDFELSEDEMSAISGLDRGEAGRTGGNPATNNDTF